MYSIVHVAMETIRKRQILPFNQNLSSVYFSACELQPFSCHDLANMPYTHKLSKLFSAPLSGTRITLTYLDRRRFLKAEV